MITRRNVLTTGAMGAALATFPFLRSERALAQSSSSFDFYISPTGDDNNPGTLASPWSITALNNNASLYGGRRVGLLPGTYQYGTKGGVRTTIYSLYQGISNTVGPALTIQGGTNGAPTYLGSSDNSGNYSARSAIISGADPSSGSLPTVAGALLGQSLYQSTGAPATQIGNITFDGLVIQNFTWAAIVFDGSNGQPMAGITIQNCEIAFGQNVVSNNNPGAIWLNFPQNASIQNCLIHDLKSNAIGSSSTMQHCGVIQFNNDTAGSYPTNIVNCTFYNCCAISNKDGFQSMNVSYCYCGYGTFGAPTGSNLGGTIQNFLTASGHTINFHHNIVLGPVLGGGESSNQANEGIVNIYNNTFYHPSTAGYGPQAAFYGYNLSGLPSGSWNFYNNLIWSDKATPAYDAGDNFCATVTFQKNNAGNIPVGTCNYNCYGSNSNGVNFGTDWNSGDFNWSLATWRTKGFDANSTTISTTPFSGTPTEAQTQTFSVSGPASTAGTGGKPCGALDGTGLVGCNFVGQPVPNAPVLKLG